jgi:hypothetical protein
VFRGAQHFARHSYATVADRECGIAPWREANGVSVVGIWRDCGGVHGNGELFAFRHGVARVDHQIHQDLFELAAIREDESGIPCGV